MNGSTADMLTSLYDIATSAKIGVGFGIAAFFYATMITSYLRDISKALNKIADNAPKK